MKRGRVGKGITTVEAALVLPLLLWLTFGVIEYGWALYKSQQITNVTRQAARIAARPDATNAEVEALVSTLMGNVGIASYQLSLPADLLALTPAVPFQVEIRVAYADIELAGPPLVPLPEELSASVSMAKEGP